MIWTPERRKAALAAAERWHGTPHHDRMAEPGVGIDCMNLVVEILRGAGVLPQFDLPYYDTREGLFQWSDRLKFAFLKCGHCAEADKRVPEFGDVAVFKTIRVSGHCAFVTGPELIHAIGNRQVTRSRYTAWQQRIDCLLRFTATGLKADPKTIWHGLQDSSAAQS